MLVLALQFSRCECDACGTKRLNAAASRGNSLKTEEKTVDIVATFEQEGPNPCDSLRRTERHASAPTGSVSHRVVE